MALKRYIIEIDSRGKQATFIATYSGKLLKSIERKRGKLLQAQWIKLLEYISQDIEVIDQVIKQGLPTGIEIFEKQEKNKSLFAEMNAAFFEFYNGANEIEYAFAAKDGKALKMIITALRKQCADDAEVLATWQAMLSNWHKLDPFYQKQMDLTQINSNLNKILRELRNGKSGKSQAKNHANDIRESL